MWADPSDDEIGEILHSTSTVAMVGVSDNPEKASYQVAKWLMAHTSFQLFFVNPRIEVLFGQPVYKSVVDIPVAIDIVDVFRRAEDMPEILRDALVITPKVFWMQLGIRNQEVAQQAADAGMAVVQDRCIKIEAARVLHT